MGGSGGGTFSTSSPEELRAKVREAESQSEDAAFETALSDSLGALLGSANERDVALANERLKHAVELLEEDIEGSLDSLFGGSVKKHTYVDGLSDIDSLIIVNNSELLDQNPSKIIGYIAEKLANGAIEGAKISTGSLAVTVDYDDGMSIQLLPAIKTSTGLKVPSWTTNDWSNINPEKFATALTKRNQECAGKLVPTIKLAKAINATLPEDAQLSGYHIESLAISAFRSYEGPKTVNKMLPHFFDRSKDLVLSAITDKSGQSVHVDEYLGADNSEQRKSASHILSRIHKRMRNATAAHSQDQWLALFE